LKEQPLARGVFEAWFEDSQFHCATGMHKELGETCGLAGANFPPDTLSEIENTRPDDEAPAQISQAVVSGVEREGIDVVGEHGISDEASGGMRVQPDHEEEREMVRVPKCLEALLSYFVMCSGEHQKHDEKHEMTGDAARLGIMDLLGGLLAHLCWRVSFYDQMEEKWGKAYGSVRR
jgi:hypothetical protein